MFYGLQNKVHAFYGTWFMNNRTNVIAHKCIGQHKKLRISKHVARTDGRATIRAACGPQIPQATIGGRAPHQKATIRQIAPPSNPPRRRQSEGLAPPKPPCFLGFNSLEPLTLLHMASTDSAPKVCVLFLMQDGSDDLFWWLKHLECERVHVRCCAIGQPSFESGSYACLVDAVRKDMQMAKVCPFSLFAVFDVVLAEWNEALSVRPYRHGGFLFAFVLAASSFLQLKLVACKRCMFQVPSRKIASPWFMIESIENWQPAKLPSCWVPYNRLRRWSIDYVCWPTKHVMRPRGRTFSMDHRSRTMVPGTWSTGHVWSSIERTCYTMF